MAQWLPARLEGAGPELIVHEREPENAELPLSRLNNWTTPNHAFYRRNHFPYPQVDPAAWRLEVTGAVHRHLRLTREDLLAMDQALQWTTLECSGNKRACFHPPAEGTPWGPGAIGNAEWGGVPLARLLDLAGPHAGAAHVLFTGADKGIFKETGERVQFERSLPLAKARRPDVLLALTMNGEPLPERHGAPLRLVVPGWYAMTAVKWLTRIEVRREQIKGPFQSRDYVYLPPGAPVTRQKLNAAITQPAEGAQVPPGRLVIRGAAWGGAQQVEVSIDGGWRWLPAEWAGPALPHAWRFFQIVTPALKPGRYVLAARASDAAGRTQPLAAPWNAKGYGNNAIVPVRITVAEA